MDSSLSPESSLSPDLRTDIGILRLQGSVIEDCGDHLILRSPHNPQYHWGNALFVTTGDPNDAARWLERYTQAFPAQDWVAIGLPSAPSAAARELFEEAGVKVEELSALESARLPQIRPCPSGYEVRALTAAEDWEQLVQAKLQQAAEENQYDMVLYEQFTRARIAEIRHLSDEGRGRWFGAFASAGQDAGRLCSSLGIILLGLGTGEAEARYQSVLTDSAHRRRGLAGCLLGTAAQWSQEQGAQRWIIVTEADNPAGRLYRSVGFHMAAPSFEAYRAPKRSR